MNWRTQLFSDERAGCFEPPKTPAVSEAASGKRPDPGGAVIAQEESLEHASKAGSLSAA
jgi:hypothetical protein